MAPYWRRFIAAGSRGTASIKKSGSRSWEWFPRLYWRSRVGTDYPLYKAHLPAENSPGVMSEAQLYTWFNSARAGISAGGWLNDMALYERFVDGILVCDNADIVPLSSIGHQSRSRTQIALRHDIDAGIWAAPTMAEMLQSKGVAGSFYLLHTSPYYGVFVKQEPGVFLRQPATVAFIERLIRSGREVGLHNDALSVFFKHNVNGFTAVAAEIAWLRSLGAAVESTTAHNSAPVFGAENFEIFSEWGRRSEMVHFNGCKVKLGCLSASGLGLKFEGNHPVDGKTKAGLDDYLKNLPENALREKAWLTHHFLQNPLFRSAYDADAWLIGRDTWFIASRWPTPEVHVPVTTDEVIAFVASDRYGRSVVANIHPDYFA